MGEKGVGKHSQETPPPREGEPMGVRGFKENEAQRDGGSKRWGLKEMGAQNDGGPKRRGPNDTFSYYYRKVWGPNETGAQ